jgi:Uma2 family endonuclease
MRSTAPPQSHQTFAELLRELGDVPLERILLNPPIGTATEDDLVALLDGLKKRLCELVDGVLVEKTTGARESIIASIVSFYFWSYLEENDLGIAGTADGPIRIRPGRIRMPDAFFVSWERLPDEEVPDAAILDAIPDLAVEVISKGNTAEEMKRKLRDYFRAGVRLVWYLYPKTQTAVMYTSPTAKRTVRKDQAVTGGKVLPGFSVPLAELFTTRMRKRKRP